MKKQKKNKNMEVDQIEEYRLLQANKWKEFDQKVGSDVVSKRTQNNFILKKGCVVEVNKISKKNVSNSVSTFTGFKVAATSLGKVLSPVPSIFGMVAAQQLAHKLFIKNNSELQKQEKEDLQIFLNETISLKKNVYELKNNYNDISSKISRFEQKIFELETQYNIKNLLESDQFYKFLEKKSLEKLKQQDRVFYTHTADNLSLNNLNKSYVTVRADWGLGIAVFVIGTLIYNYYNFVKNKFYK
jgi:hypothetical protein